MRQKQKKILTPEDELVYISKTVGKHKNDLEESVLLNKVKILKLEREIESEQQIISKEDINKSTKSVINKSKY